ncbi:antibiotic biosynthesis monooxygenase, partial [Staphylococcus aureus]
MSKGAFVVIAEFRVKPDAMEAFLDAARDDATHSVRDEP